jgi:hypothetical protein
MVPHWQYGLALTAGLLSFHPVLGQSTDSVPGTLYFGAVEEFYSGEWRGAERQFRREVSRGVRIGTSRWIDSIAYHAMAGELKYQLGDNAAALTEFDQACLLFLEHPNWLMRVKFVQPPRPDANLVRRSSPPWGRSERQATLGYFADTQLVSYGRFQGEEVLRQGGVVQAPMFFKVSVSEIVRATALAIRRRNQLLGPLGKHDRISKELHDALSRGDNAPANHWSSSWVELLLGLALIGVGDAEQAQGHLSRGLIVDGQYDHPLTCVVLLEQGRLALEAGDAATAGKLFAEASFSAYYYEDWGVLEESLLLAHSNHLVSGGAGVFPPLAAAAEWARRAGLHAVASRVLVAQAESL